ncbi:hypothetical protein ACO0LC_06455 [Undibacterium sp. JH2W]|uniref:hypothetical protein n=1 Tax=Undibacterium sp. JH2W TaxID=3413037 RepID=UPI003BF16960
MPSANMPVPALNQQAQNTPLQRWQSYLRTTPGRMSLALGLSIAGVLLVALSGFNVYRGVREAVQTVGKDTVPSIVAAERIRFVLASAHANTMNTLLLKEGETGKASTAFRSDMEQAQRELLTAAKNITYGNEEQVPITTIMTALARYEHLLGRMQARSGDAALADLDSANALMQSTILPATLALDQANFDHLTASFERHMDSYVLALLPFILFALLTLAAMIGAQWYLKQKTRRSLNTGLFAGTVIIGVTLAYAVLTLNGLEKNLTSAKRDAFDSIHALSKTRALAYEANADESLLLIQRGHPAAQTQATNSFNNRTAQIMAIKPGELANALASKIKFGGQLGVELTNITFPGEEAAAVNTLKTWARYMEIDQKIRQLEESGQHDEALTLTLGEQNGQSNWAFSEFDKALGKTIEINQQAFDRRIEMAFSELNWFPYILLIAVLASIIAVVAGMKPRLDEYRF